MTYDYDTSMMILINYVFYIFLLIGFSIYYQENIDNSKFNFKCSPIKCKLIKDICVPKKVVTIIRGVPGIGKDTYVDFIENKINDMQLHSICNDDIYFIDNNINFSMKELLNAKRHTLSLFLQYISQNINRIYITNISPKIEDYQYFINIAKQYNYKVNIVSIDCYDNEHLHYFKTRSSNSITDIHVESIYSNWEKDDNEYIIEPYIKYFMGDCLPKKNHKDIDFKKYFEDDKNSDDEEQERLDDPDYNPDSDSDVEESDDEIPINYNHKHCLQNLCVNNKHNNYKIIDYISDTTVLKNMKTNLHIRINKINNRINYYINNNSIYSKQYE